jgi:hypothetical protein
MTTDVPCNVTFPIRYISYSTTSNVVPYEDSAFGAELLPLCATAGAAIAGTAIAGGIGGGAY